MPFYTLSDDADSVWKNGVDFAKPMQEGAEAVDCRLAYFAMGDPDDERTPVAAVLRMPPNHVLPRHAHPAARFEVLVQGTLDIGDRVLNPGDVMVTQANEMYGPHTAGPDGCTTVEVHGAKAGAGRAIHETEEGRRFVDYRPNDPMPEHPAWKHSRD